MIAFIHRITIDERSKLRVLVDTSGEPLHHVPLATEPCRQAGFDLSGITTYNVVTLWCLDGTADGRLASPILAVQLPVSAQSMGDCRPYLERDRHDVHAVIGEGKFGDLEHTLGARFLQRGLEPQPCCHHCLHLWV